MCLFDILPDVPKQAMVRGPIPQPQSARAIETCMMQQTGRRKSNGLLQFSCITASFFVLRLPVPSTALPAPSVDI